MHLIYGTHEFIYICITPSLASYLGWKAIIYSIIPFTV